MQLDDYLDKVKLLAKQRNGRIFFNDSLEYAATVVEHILAGARWSVSILTGNLNPQVYGSRLVLEMAQEFLRSSDRTAGRMRIIMEDISNYTDNPFLINLGYFQRQEIAPIEVRTVSFDVRNRYGFHLLMTDNDSYRFEPDKSNLSSVVSFGDNDGAKHLGRVFNRIWDLSVPVVPIHNASNLRTSSLITFQN